MKTTLTILALLLSIPARADSLRCDFVMEDGKEQTETLATLDPGKGLLDMRGRRGDWQMPVLTESTVYPYNAPAVSFDRRKECKVSSARLASGATGFNFVCSSEEGLGLDAVFEIAADRKSASYSGMILLKDMPGQRFLAIFRNCH